MRLYETYPQPSQNQEVGYIEARHKWGLPGVICDACKETWGIVGVAYPTIDLTHNDNRKDFILPPPIPFDKFPKIVSLISHLNPNGLPLPPGTQLGPLVGKACGPFNDFVWNGLWDILVKEGAYYRILENKLELDAVKPRFISLDIKGEEQLLELQIPPLSRLIPPAGTQPACSACGRLSMTRPAEIVIDKLFLPPLASLFRPVNFPTIILATDQFKNTVEEIGLTGLIFHEVAVK
jgi:uncharacterized double-CXXCG motif protein